ncbi:MAG: VCBS repeat-containing protein [Clostridia bacterium]|nr:VCBS repeat-containing protein [Clostridia bacterium]
MKKLFSLLLALSLLFTACSAPKAEPGPLLTLLGNGYAYLVGQETDGEFVNIQKDENYKLFDLTTARDYLLVPSEGEPFVLKGTGEAAHLVSATGTYEIPVDFENAEKINSELSYIAIGGATKDAVIPRTVIDENGSFTADFDGDGITETILVEKSPFGDDGSTMVMLLWKNASGDTKALTSLITGDNYLSGFTLFAADINADKKAELILTASGRDYMTEVFTVSSAGASYIGGYHMGN